VSDTASAVRVCALADLVVDQPHRVVLGSRPVCLVRTGDQEVHAIDDTCTHADVSLAEGEVEGLTIECWLHGSRFDLVTGEPTGLPATRPVAVHDVTIDDSGDVLVAVKEQ
jgi:3-phenylpropionate/trans-cinnamate dioxygenase ferredoxin component